MRNLTTFCLLLFSAIVFGQTDSIATIESRLSEKKGIAYVRDALALSQMYFERATYHKAADLAQKAYAAARRERQKEYMAKALNAEGKAIMQITNLKEALKLKALKGFEESNKLTADTELRLDNLQRMETLALQLGDTKDLEKIRRDMAPLKGEAPPSETKGGGLFGRRKKALEEFQKTQEQNITLESELNELTAEQKALREQQRALLKLVEQKDAAIQDMSMEQTKQALLLSEQERILDSLIFSGILDSMELAQKEMLVKQQESELGIQKAQRNLMYAVAGLALLLAFGLYHRNTVFRRYNAVLSEKNTIIEQERKHSEELLLNILPAAVAEELKNKGVAATHHFEQATVLFTDFKGFSKIAKLLPPDQLIQALDYAFRNFDRIIGQHGLEKIKTIGDAYMCAGGLPTEDGSHPVNVVKAALEIQQFLEEWNRERFAKGEPLFEARIGIHTGPLVAGVVGSKKFAYDIWGDTVNIAARMESSSLAGQVNISATTFAHVKDEFHCEYRGKVPAKNVGEVEMYFVKGKAA